MIPNVARPKTAILGPCQGLMMGLALVPTCALSKPYLQIVQHAQIIYINIPGNTDDLHNCQVWINIIMHLETRYVLSVGQKLSYIM